MEKSVPWVYVCHHSASLVMSIGDPQNRFFYPYLTLMMDSYNLKSLGLVFYLNNEHNAD